VCIFKSRFRLWLNLFVQSKCAAESEIIGAVRARYKELLCCIYLVMNILCVRAYSNIVMEINSVSPSNFYFAGIGST